MQCRLCNEHIDEIEFEFDEIIQIDEEYWHADCYAEYFEDAEEVAELV